ncbi:hypothetical protein D3C84_859450 [compost metagenome]
MPADEGQRRLGENLVGGGIGQLVSPLDGRHDFEIEVSWVSSALERGGHLIIAHLIRFERKGRTPQCIAGNFNGRRATIVFLHCPLNRAIGNQP